MNEISEGLSACGSLVKISALSPERVGRNYALGLELVVAHGTTKLYLTQRCHGCSPSLRNLLEELEKEYLCHDLKIVLEEIGLVATLGGLYLLASQKGDKLPTPRTGR
jgi:hypothetical protein